MRRFFKSVAAGFLQGRAPSSRAARQRRARLGIEHLEDRAVPALTASLSQGVLHVDGPNQADTIYLHETSAGQVYVDGVDGSYLAAPRWRR
jgi:hypothetical protein